MNYPLTPSQMPVYQGSQGQEQSETSMHLAGLAAAAAAANNSNNNNNANNVMNMDSLTLGQLRAIAPPPKPNQSYYSYRYDDEDNVMNEISEFYSYVEMPHVSANLKAWTGSFKGEWTKSSMAQRKTHVEVLLEGLEHRDTEIRYNNARRLFYIVQGTFAETSSPEHQQYWIFENCRVVRSCNGVGSLVDAIKIAHHKHDLLYSLSDADALRMQISAAERADFIEEVTSEISMYLGMLYHLIQVFKGHDDFADELMSMEPPLPIYLFTVVANMREKLAKGYPMKKLLLVLWKTILSVCGGMREVARVKKLSRELANLPPLPEETIHMKSSPIDIEMFRQETSVKYPTFTPLVQPEAPTSSPASPKARKNVNISTSRLANAYSPIPVRHHYNHHDELDHQIPGVPQNLFGTQQNQQGPYRAGPQPATPAPTPPPSPKPKKQQYQTDQTRPFLFPFSKRQFRNSNGRLVPFAIDEADSLFNKHMYVSQALWQMWKTREECMTAESGLSRMPGSEEEEIKPKVVVNESDSSEVLPDEAILDAEIEKTDTALNNPDASTSDKRKLRERKEDLMRLKRVEQIYVGVLPVLSSWSLIMLKLLLCTVSANGPQGPNSSSATGFPPNIATPDQPPPPPPSLDEIDVVRHREIVSKAISAILLLVLKWFKVSHAMKFHHMGQVLLDTNCLLLIMKVFGMQEIAHSVVSKAESPEHAFFRFCQLHHSKNPQPIRPEDNMITAPRQTIKRKHTLPNGQVHEEEVELLTEFSWRNFFSAINFAKITQKLSKHRSHRIWMLVQYKSSAVLKRVLRVIHPMLQLHVLKLIKSQVPFCGRKWRQSNMKTITSIYLNCRPDLRDEWLTGTEADDASDAQAQEQALRHLTKFYNTTRYGPQYSSTHGQAHRRSASMSHGMEGLQGPELSHLIRPLGTPNLVDADVFPPVRSQAPDPSFFLPYMTEDIAFEEEYEEYLSDLGSNDEDTLDRDLFVSSGNSAWSRLPDSAAEIAGDISDSESVVTIGDLGEDLEVRDENLNDWTHMSPKTMAALPKSPGHRRTSSGGGFRPVLSFDLDNLNPLDIEEEEDESSLGPVPRDTDGPFASAGGVDEVEAAYGV